MDERDLTWVENTLNALTKGPNGNSQAYIIAHGWSGNYNGLGHAIDWVLSHPSKSNFNQAKYHLQAMIEHLRLCHPRDADLIAESGLKYYFFGRCLSCCGADVVPVCIQCGGTGWTAGTELDRKCKKVIEMSLEHMNAQQAKRLRNYVEEPERARPAYGNVVESVYGTYKLPARSEY